MPARRDKIRVGGLEADTLGETFLDLRPHWVRAHPSSHCRVSGGWLLFFESFTEAEIDRLRILIRSEEYIGIRHEPIIFRMPWLLDRL